MLLLAVVPVEEGMLEGCIVMLPMRVEQIGRASCRERVFNWV